MRTALLIALPGTSEAAMQFYRDIFGGSAPDFMRYSDLLDGVERTADDRRRIVHGQIQCLGLTLMFVDRLSTDDAPSPDSGSVAIDLYDIPVADAERYFAALSAGGRVIDPLRESWWSAATATVQDRFGIRWILTARANEA